MIDPLIAISIFLFIAVVLFFRILDSLSRENGFTYEHMLQRSEDVGASFAKIHEAIDDLHELFDTKISKKEFEKQLKFLSMTMQRRTTSSPHHHSHEHPPPSSEDAQPFPKRRMRRHTHEPGDVA